MPRKIKALQFGTEVVLKENNEDVTYIVTDHKIVDDEVVSVEILRKQLLVSMKMNNTNVSTYTGSLVDQFLEGDFLDRFDAATLSCLQAISIPTYDYGDTEPSYISRKAYIPSNRQLFLDLPTTLEPDNSMMKGLFANSETSNANTARIARDNGGTAQNWWSRSPYSNLAFVICSSNGSSNSSIAANPNWVRPALSVSADTIVSDEGANIIYLMPEYQEFIPLDYDVVFADIQTKYTKAVVKYDTENLEDVEVLICNNYGDAEQVWEDATDQHEITFSNSAKTTENWKYALRVSGKSTGKGKSFAPMISMA